MNHMEKAIKKAIEGGWKPEKHRSVIEYNPNNKAGVRGSLRASLTHNDIFADPLFWKALGKAMGWEKDAELLKSAMRKAGGNPEYPSGISSNIGYHTLQKWHRFIDHLAEGKDADSFFNKLLR